MTGTHQLWSLGLVREEEWHISHDLVCKQSIRDPSQVGGPAYPPFKHKATQDSWVPENLRRRAASVSLQPQPCEKNEKVIHHK
eukprot:c28246_g1_i1 orf=61-309(+)